MEPTPQAGARRVGENRNRPGPALVHLLILNLLAAGLLAVFLNGSLGEWGGDNIQFQILARAMVTNEGYVDLHLVGAPPHVRLPPVFPLLLTPFVALGLPLIAMKAFVAVLSIAGLNVAYLFLSETLDRAGALLAVSCTLCAAAFLDPALAVMSEGPFFLFSVVALHRLRRLFGRPDARLSEAIGCGLLVAAAILTRLVGVVLLPAIALHAIFVRPAAVTRGKRLARLVVVAVVVGLATGPWVARGVHLQRTAGRGYLDEFTSKLTAGAPPGPAFRTDGDSRGVAGLASRIARRPMQNLLDFRDRLADAARPPAARALGEEGAEIVAVLFVTLCGTLVALSLVGLARGILVRRGVVDVYTALYLAALSIWVGGGARLVMPVLVFLFAYAAEGATAVGDLLRRLGPARAPAVADGRISAGRALLGGLLLANLAVTFGFPSVRDRLRGRYLPWWEESLAAARDLGEKAGTGAVVVCLPDNVPYHVAGLRAPILVPRDASEEATFEAMRESPADYVIVTPFLKVFSPKIAAAVDANPGLFEEIDRRSKVRVYRFVRDGVPPFEPAPGDGDAPDRVDPPPPAR